MENHDLELSTDDTEEAVDIISALCMRFSYKHSAVADSKGVTSFFTILCETREIRKAAIGALESRNLAHTQV